MYIAMNRFEINTGMEEGFEELWRKRDSHLEGVPGFREFHLLRGPGDDGFTLYASHTVWESEQDFRNWTESDAFAKAHRQARAPDGTYRGHPRLEGFTQIL